MSGRYRDSSYICLLFPYGTASLLTCHTRVVYSLQSRNLHWYMIVAQSPQFTLWSTLDFVHSAGFDKRVMTCIHIYSIIQNKFTALKFLCILPVHSSLQPLVTTGSFTVFIVLLFPENHKVGITLYVTSSDWLISLKNMHLSFLHVFSWFPSSFFFF